jgi:hypothetical protein
MPGQSELLWGLLFGSIGGGDLLYGRKQKRTMPLVCGLGLILAPMLVPGALWIVVSGVVLVALPFIIRD